MISQLLERIFPWTQPSKTGTEAKQRLKLIIAHDRTSLTPEIVEMMRKGILEVMEKYVEIDPSETEFSLHSDERTTALTASFPIRRLKSKEQVIPIDSEEYGIGLSLETTVKPQEITVIVPGTTANLGPGFDCLGAALSLSNKFKFEIIPEQETPVTFVVKGKDAETVTTDSSNLAYRAFVRLYEHLQQTPPNVKMEIELGVPLARGLGSSATAIVGGLMGANALVDTPLSLPEIMEIAIALEGHPDNVVPALLGGCRLAVQSSQNKSNLEVPLFWHPDIVPVVAIPDFELSTESARKVIPKEFSRGDAIFNISRLGLLLKGLETGNKDWLQEAMMDKIHQPYRQKLIKGYEEVKFAAMKAGAYGMVISGAGPTLLALTDATQAESVATAMKSAWEEVGVKAETLLLSLDQQGARYEEN